MKLSDIPEPSFGVPETDFSRVPHLNTQPLPPTPQEVVPRVRTSLARLDRMYDAAAEQQFSLLPRLQQAYRTGFRDKQAEDLWVNARARKRRYRELQRIELDRRAAASEPLEDLPHDR